MILVLHILKYSHFLTIKAIADINLMADKHQSNGQHAVLHVSVYFVMSWLQLGGIPLKLVPVSGEPVFLDTN